MLYTDYIDELKQLAISYNPYFVQITYNDDLPVGFGRTYDKTSNFEIGICSKCEYVSDDDYVKTLVSFFHESAHVDQNKYLFHNDKSYSKCAGDKIVANRNPKLYMLNHKMFRHEIDAEMRGLISTYGYLCDKCGEYDANKLICNYVKNQLMEPGNIYYFDKSEIDIESMSVDDVFNEFDNLLHSDYQKRLCVNIETTDITTEYCNYGSLILARNFAKSLDVGKTNMVTIINENNGYKQLDQMLYVIAVCRPDDLKQYPILSKTDIRKDSLGVRLKSPAILKLERYDKIYDKLDDSISNLEIEL